MGSGVSTITLKLVSPAHISASRGYSGTTLSIKTGMLFFHNGHSKRSLHTFKSSGQAGKGHKHTISQTKGDTTVPLLNKTIGQFVTEQAAK